MNDDAYFGAVAILLAGFLLLALAWLIGVQGRLTLISNYRAHPERFPDGRGLGQWMGWALAGGGLSFVACAVAFFAGLIDAKGVAPWTLATAGWLVSGALSGIARYRRPPPPGPDAKPGGRGSRPGRSASSAARR